MESTIIDLWNGEIAPCEHCGAQDQKANLLLAKVRRSREALDHGLNAEQKELSEQHAQAWEDYLLRMLELAFRDGFTVGSRLTEEVYSDC